MRLLVIEDELKLRSVLERGLAAQGYVVDTVESAEGAIDMLSYNEYAVALVDWRLPGMSGLDVVRHIRTRKLSCAILMLTARDATVDRVAGLDAGADDYLVKPFDFGELVARIRALQRRPASTDGRVLRRGDLSLDPQMRTVYAGAMEVHLTNTEFRILELIMLRAPAVVDRRQIAQHAWQDETTPVGSNAIDVRMARLRAKLAGTGTEIVTVRGAGYRLASA